MADKNETNTMSQPSKAPRAERPRSPRGSGRALGGVALVLAVIALLAIAAGAWQWWRVRSVRAQAAQQLAGLTRHVDTLAQQVAAQNQKVAKVGALAAQTSALAAQTQTNRDRLSALAQRNQALAQAVANLAQGSRAGRRDLILDQVAALLRMGQQRYRLFHDATGAHVAFKQAGDLLASLGDPSLADLRGAIAAETTALGQAQSTSRVEDVLELGKLRSEVLTLPLKPLTGSAPPSAQGFWARAWHAVKGVVVVRRVGHAQMAQAGSNLVHQLVALDLAEAEAARLAWNEPASQAALQRASKLLQQRFDQSNAAVKAAQASIERMLAQAPAELVQLGTALRRLQTLRAVDGAAAASAPAAASSAGGTP